MIASITRIKLKNPLKLFKFIAVAPKIMKQAANSPGNLSYTGRYKGYLTFWTITTWEDEKSMIDFVRSGLHLEVMKQTRYYSDDFSTANWIVDNTPSWKDGEKILSSKNPKAVPGTTCKAA